MYLQGYGTLPSPLEQALEGKDQGANVCLEIPAAQCYGEHDASLFIGNNFLDFF